MQLLLGLDTNFCFFFFRISFPPRPLSPSVCAVGRLLLLFTYTLLCSSLLPSMLFLIAAAQILFLGKSQSVFLLPLPPFSPTAIDSHPQPQPPPPPPPPPPTYCTGSVPSFSLPFTFLLPSLFLFLFLFSLGFGRLRTVPIPKLPPA